jgi:hypothetical protein
LSDIGPWAGLWAKQLKEIIKIQAIRINLMAIVQIVSVSICCFGKSPLK